MTAAASQIIATAASAVIFILAILFIGAVALGIVRRLVPALEFSIGLAFGAGLFVLFLTSWYLFLLAIPVRVGFAGLLGTAVAAASLEPPRRAAVRLARRAHPDLPQRADVGPAAPPARPR